VAEHYDEPLNGRREELLDLVNDHRPAVPRKQRFELPHARGLAGGEQHRSDSRAIGRLATSGHEPSIGK
jgi:hypothetical protein